MRRLLLLIAVVVSLAFVSCDKGEGGGKTLAELMKGDVPVNVYIAIGSEPSTDGVPIETVATIAVITEDEVSITISGLSQSSLGSFSVKANNVKISEGRRGLTLLSNELLERPTGSFSIMPTLPHSTSGVASGNRIDISIVQHIMYNVMVGMPPMVTPVLGTLYIRVISAR